MPLNIPVLVVNYLLSVMSDASWQKLVDSYMKMEISSVDDVLDPDVFPSGTNDLGRSLRKDLIRDFSHFHSSRERAWGIRIGSKQTDKRMTAFNIF